MEIDIFDKNDVLLSRNGYNCPHIPPINFVVLETNVTETILRTPDIKSIRFEKPRGFNHLAGQYVFVTLGDGPENMTKHFTLSSSPTEGFLEITKRLTGHPFANALAGLGPGDKVSIMGPFGDFTTWERRGSRMPRLLSLG